MDSNDVTLTGGPLKQGEYVLLKPYMTAGDERWVQNHAAKSKGANQITLTIGDIQFATFQRMVTGWHINRTVKINGKTVETPIPFNAANIEHLPRAIYRYVLKKIDELNPPDEESEEDFLTVVPASSEDN